MKKKTTPAAKALCLFLCPMLACAFLLAAMPQTVVAKMVDKAPGAQVLDDRDQVLASATGDDLLEMRAAGERADSNLWWTGFIFVTAAVLVLILAGNGR